LRDAIEPTLQLAEIERATLKPTDNLAAYDLYLRALPNLYSGTSEGTDQALALLYKAIAAEPNYALAKATAAYCYLVRCAQFVASDDERAEGIRLARETLGSHRNEPTALSWAGLALGYLAHDFEAARYCIDRSLILKPSSAAAFLGKGYLEMWLGNLPTAQDAFLIRAIRLSPLDPEMGWLLFGLSNTYAMAGRFEEGLSVGLTAIRERPANVQNYPPIIRCLVGLGHIDDARDFAIKLLKIFPEFSIAKFILTGASRDGPWRQEFIDALSDAGLPQ
jgi:adenylate cyclase